MCFNPLFAIAVFSSILMSELLFQVLAFDIVSIYSRLTRICLFGNLTSKKMTPT